jgi:hypothetical protein
MKRPALGCEAIEQIQSVGGDVEVRLLCHLFGQRKVVFDNAVKLHGMNIV